MKKILLLLIAFVAISTTSSAQFLKFGLKAGLNANSSKFEFSRDYANEIIDNVKNYAGYHLGGMLRVPLGPIYVQGDLLFTHNAYKYNLSGDNSMKIKENTLSIPTVVGFNILFLRAYAGPRFDINLGENVWKTISDKNEIKTAFNKRWLGYQIGVGVDIMKKISFDFSYNGFFKAPKQDITFDNNDYVIKQKSRQFWFTIGYYFGNPNKVRGN